MGVQSFRGARLISAGVEAVAAAQQERLQLRRYKTFDHACNNLPVNDGYANKFCTELQNYCTKIACVWRGRERGTQFLLQHLQQSLVFAQTTSHTLNKCILSLYQYQLSSLAYTFYVVCNSSSARNIKAIVFKQKHTPSSYPHLSNIYQLSKNETDQSKFCYGLARSSAGPADSPGVRWGRPCRHLCMALAPSIKAIALTTFRQILTCLKRLWWHAYQVSSSSEPLGLNRAPPELRMAVAQWVLKLLI